MTDNAPDRALLCELADALGVATEYWGYDGNLTAVSDETLIKVFAALGVDAGSTDLAQRALVDIRLRHTALFKLFGKNRKPGIPAAAVRQKITAVKIRSDREILPAETIVKGKQMPRRRLCGKNSSACRKISA